MNEILRDDAAFDIAVVAPADAQQVFVGAGIEFGTDLGIDQRGLNSQGAGLGGGCAVQIQRQAVGNGTQRVQVHPVPQAFHHAVGQHVGSRQAFQRAVLQGWTDNDGLAFGQAIGRRLDAASIGVHGSTVQGNAQQEGIKLATVFQVLLVLAMLDLVQRRLGDVDVTTFHQRGHLAVEEGEKQGADVRAVDIGIRHDDDAVVAQLLDVEVLTTDAGA